MKNLSLLLVTLIIFFSSCKKETVAPSTNQARISEEPAIEGERPMGFYTYTATFIADIKTGDRRTENCYNATSNIFFLSGDTMGQFLEDPNIISRDFVNEQTLFNSSTFKNKNIKITKLKYTMNGDTVVTHGERGVEIGKYLFRKGKDGKFVMYNYSTWVMKFMEEQKYTSHNATVMTRGIINPNTYPKVDCSVPNANFL